MTLFEQSTGGSVRKFVDVGQRSDEPRPGWRLGVDNGRRPNEQLTTTTSGTVCDQSMYPFLASLRSLAAALSLVAGFCAERRACPTGTEYNQTMLPVSSPAVKERKCYGPSSRQGERADVSSFARFLFAACLNPVPGVRRPGDGYQRPRWTPVLKAAHP
jgi:hypothetical protein